MNTEPATTLVVGIGRPSGGDDAVGLVVADRLAKMGISATSVTDGATLSALLVEAEKAIVIDAIASSSKPGTVVVLSGEAKIRKASSENRRRRAGASVSSHGLSVLDAIRLAKALGGAADVSIVGISIELTSLFGDALSPSVEAAVDEAVLRVSELLSADSSKQ